MSVMTSIPQTWAGQESTSIAGYLARRIGTGVGSTLIHRAPKGVTAYSAPADLLRQIRDGRVQFEVLPSQVEMQERREAHENSYAAERSWAAGFSRHWLTCLTQEGREHYQAAAATIRSLNGQFRQILSESNDDWNRTATWDPHARNVAIGPHAADRWQKLRNLLVSAEERERDWQLECYRSLMEAAKMPPRLERSFRRAMEEFKVQIDSYLEYARAMAAGDPEKREHERKKMEGKAFLALWKLHETTQSLLLQCKIPGAEGLKAPLTFLWKTQSYLISQGPNGMAALEPFLERTWNLRGLIREKDGWELDEGVVFNWGLPLTELFYRSLRVAGPPGLPYLSHHRPQAYAAVQGGIELFAGASGENASTGYLAHWPHTGSIDYAAILSALYLFGLNPPAIVAENAFRTIPVMRGYIRKRGIFLSRTNPIGAYRQMEDRVAEGMTVSVFGTGTRGLGWPFTSPYVDLSQEGALHLPGEYFPSRDMTGMHVRAAGDPRTRAPILVFSTNTHRSGVPEPSIPRDWQGFVGGHQMFRYARPGSADGFVALAGILSPDSFVTVRDLSADTRKDWLARQANVAIIREMEMRAGFSMDAGPLSRYHL